MRPWIKSERSIMVLIVVALLPLALFVDLGIVTGVARGAFTLFTLFLLGVDFKGFTTWRALPVLLQFRAAHPLALAVLILCTFPVWTAIYVYFVARHPYQRGLHLSDMLDAMEADMRGSGDKGNSIKP